jgi:hypothetical protein
MMAGRSDAVHRIRPVAALVVMTLLTLSSSRSRADGIGVGDLRFGYEAGIGLQAPCHSCGLILTDDLVTTPTMVSARMHAETQDLTSSVSFTMTSDLTGEVKMEGRSINANDVNALGAGFPGITLDDTVTPVGQADSGMFALFPHLEMKGEIILDHTFDSAPPGTNGTMQVRFSIFDAATSNPYPGYGNPVTLPVDQPFDIILGSTEVDVRDGGAIRYSVWLGEVGGGSNHGAITNAEVNLGERAPCTSASRTA